MSTKVVSLIERIDRLERAAFDQAKTAEQWEMFYEARDIIQFLPDHMLERLIDLCRERISNP